jgi:hypothetical protein
MEKMPLLMTVVGVDRPEVWGHNWPRGFRVDMMMAMMGVFSRDPCAFAPPQFRPRPMSCPICRLEPDEGDRSVSRKGDDGDIHAEDVDATRCQHLAYMGRSMEFLIRSLGQQKLGVRDGMTEPMP